MQTGSMSELVKQYEPQRTLRFCIFGMGMGPIIGQLDAAIVICELTAGQVAG